MACSKTRDSSLRRLVEMYGTWRAYVEVSRTCDLRGFADMVNRRADEFNAELSRYSRTFYGSDSRPMLARSMDDVITLRNQLTLF